jgi:hypothetical protein
LTVASGYTPAMWKALRLIACLVFFVPAFALLGAFAALDAGERTAWAGLVAGALVGLFSASASAGSAHGGSLPSSGRGAGAATASDPFSSSGNLPVCTKVRMDRTSPTRPHFGPLANNASHLDENILLALAGPL